MFFTVDLVHPIRDPDADGPISHTGRDHGDRQMTHRGDNPTTPASAVRIERLRFDAAKRQVQIRSPVLGQSRRRSLRIDTPSRGLPNVIYPLVRFLTSVEGFRLRAPLFGGRIDPSHPSPAGLRVPDLDITPNRDAERDHLHLIGHHAAMGSTRLLCK
ncbi:hypothetical protein [Nocardia sp. NPDC057440]|uniref:hypothetical protein n=1 Tax=Nocardia sp. NPDC057440 TaxID=3346134 RepID=UPI003671DF12